MASQPVPNWAIWDRMEHHRVPGVSIAVLNDGVVAWARGYGLKQAGGSDSVSVSTLFQAASISKPVTAAAILRLAECGVLSLDVDVNEYLKSWQVQPNEFTADSPVTLRGLLAHNAGVTVPGFPGYVAGKDLPTAVDVLSGRGNTDPVELVSVPGERDRYSGGGYTIAQVLLEDLTGKPFHSVMEAEVLDPVGMSESTFEQPLPERLAAVAAVGHGGNGDPIEGRWRTYPEQAAAGLWTTPTDLARFLLDLRAAYLRSTDAVLEPATVREMLSRGPGGRGLGFRVEETGDSLIIYHSGGNKGYRSFMVLYPVTGDGVVVMTNGEGGAELRMEIVRAVSRVYGWPHFEPSVRHWVRIVLLVAGVVLTLLTVIVLTVRRVRNRRVLRA
jgi:CubicO group peptidase (beta-lactamase class C family)